MKQIKNILFTSLFGLGVGLSLFAGISLSDKIAIKTNASSTESSAVYIPFNTTNFTCSDDTIDLSKYIKPRGEVFWTEEKRSFNALDSFYNGFDKEDWVGTITSTTFNVTNPYISFTFGGDKVKKRNYVVLCEGETEIESTKVYNTYFDDPKVSLNMVLRVITVPDEYLGEGHSLYIKLVDKASNDFAGITFGALRVNQTALDVAKAISVHKNSLEKTDFGTKTKNSDARTETIRIYNEESEYETFRKVEITDADEGFESDASLLNWAYDRDYSLTTNNERFDINFNDAVSSESVTSWNEKMTFNKTGNKFFDGWTATSVETNKYRIISNSFTLSSDYISIKMAGRNATLQLLSADDLSNVLVSYSNENISFKDAGVTNIISTDSRLNTMARVYLDVSSFKGRNVAIALADSDNKDNWGVAFFDELITKYDSLPTLKLDKIEQVYGDNHFYGVVRNFYSGNADTTLGKAISYLNNYYDTVRKATNGSLCSLVGTESAKTLLASYEALSTEVQNVISAADDYTYGINAGDEWYNNEVQVDRTVGESIQYLKDNSNTSNLNRAFSLSAEDNTGYAVIIVLSVIFVIVSSTFVYINISKKKSRV